MKDMFFIQIDDNDISLSSNMLTWIDPAYQGSHSFALNSTLNNCEVLV